MKAENVLIDQPEKQSLPRRIFYGIATIIAWALWGLLWLPVLHYFAGRLDIPPQVARYIPGIVLGGAHEIAEMAWIAPASLIIFLAWSLYEGRNKGGDRQRRRATRPVALPAAAESIGTTTFDAERIHDSRRAVLHVHDDGHIDVEAADGTPENVESLDERRRRTA